MSSSGKPTPERKFVLTKATKGGGDWLLPSNDARRLYRLMRYMDGPSQGLDWPKDKEVWGVWVWSERLEPGRVVDIEDWDRWELVASTLASRQEAIDEAMRLGGESR